MKPGFGALVVDDDELSRHVTAVILKRLGAGTVTEAADGAAALAWADAAGSDVDIVVCDLRMPQVDGIETLVGLAERTRPALFLIASGADARLLHAAAVTGERAGLKRLQTMPKPVTLEKMQAALATVADASSGKWSCWDARVFVPPDCSTKILRGMSKGEFMPFFQPRLATNRQDLRGAESHFRWLHPSYGVLAPESFMGVAESTGLQSDVFFAFLAQSLIECAEWRRFGNTLNVSIDLPKPLLLQHELPRRLESFVSAYGLQPEHLTLQVSEETVLDGQGEIYEMCTRLRVRGFGLALADCSIRASAVKYLQNTPLSAIKLAEHVVRTAENNPGEAESLTSFVSTLRRQDLTVVADGVLNLEQWTCATEVGCTEIQGKLIAPPIPAQEFARWLREQERTSAA